VKALEDPKVRWIVSACPTCTVALRHEFAALLQSEGHADWVDRAAAVASKVRDFSSLVKELVDAGRLSLEAAEGSAPVTYHDSCHLKRKLHAHEPPRELLGAAGYEIREMKDSDVCCGMGGSYTLKFPEISAPILARKLENVKATGVDTVAMDCPGCMMQIGGGLDRAGSPARTRHVAELLAERLPPAHAAGGNGQPG
jgi:Fe-S oxidoreductase